MFCPTKSAEQIDYQRLFLRLAGDALLDVLFERCLRGFAEEGCFSSDFKGAVSLIIIVDWITLIEGSIEG